MTITEARAEMSADAPEWHSWTRRTWLLIWGSAAAVVLLAAGLIVGAKVNSLDDEYGPIGYGSFGGFNSPGIRSVGGTRRLVTIAGRTTPVYASMSNSGAHSVKVTAVDLDDVTVKAEWAPIADGNDAVIPDANAQWRSFPAIVGAYTEVQMRYTIRRPPHCQDKPMNPNGGEFYSDSHVVHWESLLGDHESTVRSYPDPTSAVQVC